jgi:hypothetical protein
LGRNVEISVSDAARARAVRLQMRRRITKL